MADNVASGWVPSQPLARPVEAVREAVLRFAEIARAHVRLTVALSIVLVCACFAVATVLQMRRDYAQALALAESFTMSQAESIAVETGRTLDRMAALGTAYVAAIDAPSAETVVAGAEADRILNIAVADANGRIVSIMKGDALAAEPLSNDALERSAKEGQTIFDYADPAIGTSPLTLLFRADKETPPRFIVMPLDPVALLPDDGAKGRLLGEQALFTPEGNAVGLSQGWGAAPPASALRTASSGPTVRYVDFQNARRIIAFVPVPGWPLVAASSIGANDALATWYGSLPLYLFVIVGPALAGAALAALLVGAVEHAGRARAALAAAQAREALATPAPPAGAREETALVTRLAQSERRAREAERAKFEFVIHMSHELRTPLNAIIGFAEMIAAQTFGPPGHAKYLEYANDIAEAGRSLHSRIGDILEFSRTTADEFPIRPMPVKLADIARRCAEHIHGAALLRRVEVIADLPDLPAVDADPDAVKRILAILLSNALRYTPEGGTIRLEGRIDGAAIIIGIRDNGYGFSAAEAKTAGTPFVRFSRPEEKNDGGAGLGLAVAMALARRMGGALRLAGAAGEGTWAELRLAKV